MKIKQIVASIALLAVGVLIGVGAVLLPQNNPKEVENVNGKSETSLTNEFVPPAVDVIIPTKVKISIPATEIPPKTSKPAVTVKYMNDVNEHGNKIGKVKFEVPLNTSVKTEYLYDTIENCADTEADPYCTYSVGTSDIKIKSAIMRITYRYGYSPSHYMTEGKDSQKVSYGDLTLYRVSTTEEIGYKEYQYLPIYKGNANDCKDAFGTSICYESKISSVKQDYSYPYSLNVIVMIPNTIQKNEYSQIFKETDAILQSIAFIK